MSLIDFAPLTADLVATAAVKSVGRVIGTDSGGFLVAGLRHDCVLGDRVSVRPKSGMAIPADVLRLGPDGVTVLPDGPTGGVALGDQVVLEPRVGFCPDGSWLGRVIDSRGRPLDGRAILAGSVDYPLQAPPRAAAERRALGERLPTGQKLFNTILPLARGQRIGLFAGSGIGKSTLIGQLAVNVEVDVTVIALVGERGREVREFVEHKLGPTGMARAVVVAATSDKSSLEKRRAAWAAMSVAEYFRDQGKQVLLVVDSITRFAEAHRDVALAAGESASMRGYPPSTMQIIMSLCERAGPGAGTSGDITALFSVLVAASDMDEPIADIIRGVLDGHVILDRKIAERGRFPAVDVLRSVSRCLPDVATDSENAAIRATRRLLAAYDSAELMIRAGLYVPGSDPLVDQAIESWPKFERYFSEIEVETIGDSFDALAACFPLDETQVNRGLAGLAGG
ncbi:MAG: FliI/YscN family ATPase [Rhodobacteraceae bacterium]|nr:FliI/YscN family ATPase [Paracoccaceae bacterium]